MMRMESPSKCYCLAIPTLSCSDIGMEHEASSLDVILQPSEHRPKTLVEFKRSTVSARSNASYNNTLYLFNQFDLYTCNGLIRIYFIFLAFLPCKVRANFIIIAPFFTILSIRHNVQATSTGTGGRHCLLFASTAPKMMREATRGGKKCCVVVVVDVGREKKPMAHRPTARIFLLGLREIESNKKMARNSSILHPTVNSTYRSKALTICFQST